MWVFSGAANRGKSFKPPAGELSAAGSRWLGLQGASRLLGSNLPQAGLGPTSRSQTCTLCRLYVKLDQFLVADHPRTDYDQITVRSMLAIVVRPVSAIKRGESRDCAPRNEYPSSSDCHSSLLRLRL